MSQGAQLSAAWTRAPERELPSWPFTAMLALYPLWWVLGLGSIAWIPLAGCMLLLLLRSGRIRVPRGAAIWLLFLLLMLVSVIGLDSPERLVGFAYRALQYAAVSVVFLYVYNARRRLTDRRILGAITIFWLTAVLGGYAGIFFPTFSFQTPLGLIIPAGLESNELIGEMVNRRLTQHNPDSWFALDPRPSAPFLYTNQWGNVYSLTLPLVIAYLGMLRGTRLFWPLAAAVGASFVPALLTLNRGMFIGLAVAGAYLLVRFLGSGQLRRALVLGLLGVTSAITAVALGVGDRLNERVETSSSTEDRANLYEETFERSLQSPLFGYGAPRPSVVEGAPPVGTQGHVWTIMFSHGFPALACFLLALAWLFFATRRTSSTLELMAHTVQLVILVECLYYGVLPNGLFLSFAAAALVLRRQDHSNEPPSVIHPDVFSLPPPHDSEVRR